MELLTYWQGFCFFFFAFFCECYGQLVGHLLIMGSSVIPVTKLSAEAWKDGWASISDLKSTLSSCCLTCSSWSSIWVKMQNLRPCKWVSFKIKRRRQMKCDSQTVPAHKSRCFPVCNTAKLISIFHVSSYSLRSHAQRDLYWVGSHSCQAFVVKVKTSTTIFHQLTQSHFASVCPLESPRMQLCVRERRWKFWFVQFRAWWLTSVDCGKRSVFHTGSVSHISFAIFFLFFSLRKRYI